MLISALNDGFGQEATVRRILSITACALYVVSAGAAQAEKYGGTLNGAVTTGGATSSTGSSPLFTSYVGQTLVIKFVADTSDNVYDAVVTIGSDLAVISFGYPNGLDSQPSSAFTGNAAIGQFTFSGHTGSYYNSGNASFFFADAKGTQAPLKGNGTVAIDFDNLRQGGALTSYDFGFKLDNGFVTGPGSGQVVTSPVPEPATWALMIAGFSLIGAGMRASGRRSRQRSSAAGSNSARPAR